MDLENTFAEQARSEVRLLRNDVDHIKDAMHDFRVETRANIGDLRKDMSDLRKDMNDLRKDMNHLSEKVTQTTTTLKNWIVFFTLGVSIVNVGLRLWPASPPAAPIAELQLNLDNHIKELKAVIESVKDESTKNEHLDGGKR